MNENITEQHQDEEAKAIRQDLLPLFDILREEGIKSDNYYFILFVLSVFSDKVIPEASVLKNKMSADEYINVFKSPLHNLKSQKYAPFISSFEDALGRLSSSGLQKIYRVLTNIDNKLIAQDFNKLYDWVLFHITQEIDQYSGTFIQPGELTRLICSIIGDINGKNVYNPFAGSASYGVTLTGTYGYIGQEINEQTWAIGKMRLMAYNKTASAKFEHLDSIEDWPSKQKFDVVVSSPPLGIKLDRQLRKKYGVTTIEGYLIKKGLESLKGDGEMYIVLSNRFLWGKEFEKLRRLLIKENLIEAIISLPVDISMRVGVQQIILILNKDKTNKKIKLVRADNCFEKERRINIIKDKEIYQLLEENKNEKIKHLSINEIKENEYNLSVKRYFLKEVKPEKGERIMRLGELLQPITGNRENLPERGKLISLKNLKSEGIQYKIDIEQVDMVEISKHGQQLISESCLLLAVHSSTLSPVYFEYTGTPIIIRSNIIRAFKVKGVDKIYLVQQINAKYVKEQVSSYQLGTSIPYIRMEDLNRIAIKVPSIEEQRAFSNAISEVSHKMADLQKGIKSMQFKEALASYNTLASLKHTLGRPRQNILSWTENLIKFFQNNNQLLNQVDSEFNLFFDRKILSVLEEIKRDLNYMTSILEKEEQGFKLESYKKELVPLREIKKIINNISDESYNFKIEKSIDIEDGRSVRGVSINKVLLRKLYDNILDNADKHGFPDNNQGNEMVIDVRDMGEVLIIEFKNNGMPFSKNFTKEMFIEKHRTTYSDRGSGLGGFHINQIATYFGNPDWDLKLDKEAYYPVIFRFKFLIETID